jgi:hypothetical protein
MSTSICLKVRTGSSARRGREPVLSSLRRSAGCVAVTYLCLATVCVGWGMSVAGAEADEGQLFPTPEAAVAALAAAVDAQDPVALRTVFGADYALIQNPDLVQATNELGNFAAAFHATNCLVRESDTRCVLEVGPEAWPLPIPIVRRGAQWGFDTRAGKEELQNRRVGRNELFTLRVMRAYVEAQREYSSRDRDGDEVLEYAQRLWSSAGTQDGLYWPSTPGGDLSPLGPLVASAQAEGYLQETPGRNPPPEPFHGYYFRILARQGKHAPGGAYDYRINGHMIGGFALVAWPAQYGVSGVMTFIVSQQGRVYQKDLGSRTARIASRLKDYDPDSSWHLSLD